MNENTKIPIIPPTILPIISPTTKKPLIAPIAAASGPANMLANENPAAAINPVSTIGAGDNFNAGLIYGLYKNNISKQQINDISENQWANIVQWGTDFAADVCMSYENYISLEYVKKVL